MHKSNIELLQCSVDAGDEESEFRFLVDKQYVKYLTIAPGLYTVDDMCFAPALIPQLPSFPTGDWKTGHIAKHPESGLPYFARTTAEQLPGIEQTWHTTFIDHLELTMGERLRSNVFTATSPQFDSTVVAKFARFAWEIAWLNAETAAYQWIEAHDIGPKFLGHLTEEGRVIGFLMEMVDGQHAGLDDLPLCKEVLSRLHDLGIKHGDVNRHNFIVRDGRATLLDFDVASKGADPDALREEAESLPDQLADTSGIGGCEVVTN